MVLSFALPAQVPVSTTDVVECSDLLLYLVVKGTAGDRRPAWGAKAAVRSGTTAFPGLDPRFHKQKQDQP